jgi:hypothetical protein
MDDMKSSTSRRQILTDHRRQGKRLTPPFLYKIGALSEVSWVTDIMPQVIWIAVAIDRLGFSEGVKASLELSRAAHEVHQTDHKVWFVWLSLFSKLSAEEWQRIKLRLQEQRLLEPIMQTVGPLISYYPECPLRLLFDDQLHTSQDPEAQFQQYKSTLTELYSRRSVLSTRVQATVIYIALVLDLLRLAKTMALSELPEIEHYPDTERSRIVASSVRATINGLLGVLSRETFSEWSTYFWNQGLKLEPCDIAPNWQQIMVSEDE